MIADWFFRGAAAVVSESRRSWVEAMRAEHDAIDDARERRRFAWGCGSALLLAPGRNDATTWVVRSVVGGGVVTAGGLAAYGLVHYPGLRDEGWLVYVAVFAVILGLYAAFSYELSRLGTARTRRTGLLVAVPALGLSAVGARGTGAISFACALSTILLPAVAAVFVTRREPRWASGAIAAGCGTIAAGLGTFIGYVIVTYVTYAGTPTARRFAEFRRSGAADYRTWAVGDNLGGAVFLLGFVLVVGLVLGLMTAAATSRAQVPESD